MKAVHRSLALQSHSLTQQADNNKAILTELLNKQAQELNQTKAELAQVKRNNDKAIQEMMHEKELELEKSRSELIKVKAKMARFENEAKNQEERSVLYNGRMRELEGAVGEKERKLSQTEE